MSVKKDPVTSVSGVVEHNDESNSMINHIGNSAIVALFVVWWLSTIGLALWEVESSSLGVEANIPRQGGVPLNHFGAINYWFRINAEGILTVWCLTNQRKLWSKILDILGFRPLAGHEAEIYLRGIHGGLASEGTDNKVDFSFDAVIS